MVEPEYSIENAYFKHLANEDKEY